MRRRFLYASALVSLTVAAPAALADREVTDEVTTPLTTSTAGDGGTADNIVITSTGRVTLTTAGTAVTADSDHTVSVEGSVDVTSDDDGGVGVLLEGGTTGGLEVSGSVSVDSESDPQDLGEDELVQDLDGPSAVGGDRVGILVDGTGAFVGDIVITNGGRIAVRGNDSASIRILTDVTGNIISNGTITMVGDRSYGLDVQAPVSGDVQITGAVNVRGEDTSAININADLGGSFYLLGSATGTGYQFNGRPLVPEYIETLDEDDVFQGGPVVLVQANIANGILFEGATGSNGIGSDSAISQRGSAPAVFISATDGDIVIGEAIQPAVEDDPDTTDTDESIPATPLGYSFVTRAGLTAAGELNDVSATGIRIGGSDDGLGGFYTATLSEGMLNDGIITVTAYSDTTEADATAMHLAEGAVLPVLTNTGNVNAVTTTVAVDGAYGTAYSLLIDEGAILNAFANHGRMSATGAGGASSITILDRSGTLGSVENTGAIFAEHTAPLAYVDEDGNLIEPDDVPHDRVAIDLSANTTGTSFHQYWVQAEDSNPDDDIPALNVTQENIRVFGDVRLGSGADTFRVEAGDVTGDIAFGDGADLLILDGTTVRAEIDRLVDEGLIDALDAEELYAELPVILGALTDSDGLLDIEVDNATLNLQGTEQLGLTNARFGEGSVLVLRIDAGTGEAGNLVASGDITFESGSRLTVSLSDIIGNGGSFELIRAGNLTVEDSLDELRDAESPYLYTASLEFDPADDNVIRLNLERKTAEELGMTANQAAAYQAAFNTWEGSELGAAIASLTSQEDFFAAYDQLLPEYAASAIQFALASNDSAVGALANRLEAVRRSPEETGGLWIQEFGYFADRAGSSFGPGYRGQGIGVAVGFDRPAGPFYAAGVNFVGSASEVSEVDGVDDPMSALSAQLGAYAGARGPAGINLDIYGGAGFDSFEHNRRVLIGEFDATPSAEWTGYHLTGSARVSRNFEFGRYYVSPALSVDYLTLFESDYTETGGGTGVDLFVGERDSTSFSSTGLLSFGAMFDNGQSWWSPTLRVGYRNEFSDEIMETEAGFVDYDETFTLRSQRMPGTGMIFGFGVSAGSGYSTFSFDYDADIRDDFIRHTGRLVIRLVF